MEMTEDKTGVTTFTGLSALGVIKIVAPSCFQGWEAGDRKHVSQTYVTQGGAMFSLFLVHCPLSKLKIY